MKERINKLAKQYNMTIPEDFLVLTGKIQKDLFLFAFCKVSSADRTFIFNNFLGATDNPNTDIYKRHEFFSRSGTYLAFGNGVYGENFVIGVHGSETGKVYVIFEEEGITKKDLLAYSFMDFLRKLRPGD